MDDDQARRRLARHEAGHGVVAWVLGANVESLGLNGHAGETNISFNPTKEAGWKAECAAMWGGVLADPGPAAFDSNELFLWWKDNPTFVDAARTAAQQVLAEHADAHERLAEALTERGRLSGAEVRAILTVPSG